MHKINYFLFPTRSPTRHYLALASMFFILIINTSETLTNFNKKNCDSGFVSHTFVVES